MAWEWCASSGHVAQKLAPFLQWPVAGHDGGPVFIPAHDHFKKMLAGVLGQLLQAKIVNLCGAPHKLTHVKRSVMCSEWAEAAAGAGMAHLSLHIIDSDFGGHSDSSHLIRFRSDRQWPDRHLRGIRGFALVNASRFASKLIARYLLVVFTLACPSRCAMVLKSTPERSR